MEKYELKTGTGLKDTLLFKWFDKQEILDEIQNLGFYSDFNDFKKEISDYSEDKLLVIADHEEVYGQNWMLCISKTATEQMFALIEAENNRLEAAKRKLEEEEAERLAEEERVKNAVYEDKPIVARPRMSGTEEETITEIEWLDVRPCRRLMKMQISRKRSDFGAPIKFSDRNAEQSGLFEFRQHKDPNFELKRKQLDAGLQACPSWTATWLGSACYDTEETDMTSQIFDMDPANTGTGGKKKLAVGMFDFCAENLTEEDIQAVREIPRMVQTSSQTDFFRQLNQLTEYEYLEFLGETLSQAAEKALGAFLKDVLPVVEVALQQNETMDVYASEFLSLRSDEVAGLGNKEDNFLRELRTFTDLVYSNGKLLSSVNWHPVFPNVVAVACAEPLKFDQRVEFCGKERNAFILIWNFADLIHPELVLRSPQECTHFRFNPDQPHLIAGGCVTGQVVLWDISKALELLRKRQKGEVKEKSDKNASNEGEGDCEDEVPGDSFEDDEAAPESGTAGNGNTAGDDDGPKLPPVEPLVISTIDESHQRPVSHLEWLPPQLHVNAQGKVPFTTNVEDVREAGRLSHQLITCAGDGHVMFWDSRINNKKKRSPSEAEDESSAMKDVQWGPLFKFTITKNDGTGVIGLSKVSLRGRIDQFYEFHKKKNNSDDDKANKTTPGRSGTMFSCTTEQGEMIYGDWRGARELKLASPESKENADAVANDPTAENKSTDDKVAWVARDHFRDCCGLCRSPFFPFLVLSVSANQFNIWKEDLNRPLFSSPIVTGTAHLTCAEWSPTRPGVIIVGRNDGSVDIWDLMDQSYRPSTTVPIAAYAITSIHFRASGDNKDKHNLKDRTLKRHRRKSQGHINLDDDRAIRAASVAEATIRNPVGDSQQLLALGDAIGNLHILDIPRNLRRRMPKEETILLALYERELDRVKYVAERAVVREKELLQRSMSRAETQQQNQAEDTETDRDKKEYKKLVEAEEKRYQLLAAKLLGPDFKATK
uniref:WD repeat-containing protein 63 n=1 Tax=Mucochytrium quahogii TaxID=96639 RepID=A0A7S2RYD5_9STRA